MVKTVGIVGLGLIGGSMAKTVREKTTCRIYGSNRSRNIVEQAISENVIHGELKNETLSECDLVILSLYAARNIEYVKTNIQYMKKVLLLWIVRVLKKESVMSFLIFAGNGTFILLVVIRWQELRNQAISIRTSDCSMMQR